MHTPGHATLNLAILGTALSPAHAAAIVAGSVAPDVPIMILYLSERLLRGTPETQIWEVVYQRRFWQDLIHGMHSIPLALLASAACWALGAGWAAAFFASMLLHALEDLPVHAIDAHRHFLPFSSWRWVSPISYWDPRYHGRTVALVEALLVTAAAAWLWRRYGLWPRVCLAGVVAFYAFSYWRWFLRRHAAVPGTFL